jgi:hypothetical protein
VAFAQRDIVWIDVPKKGPHPATVVIDLGGEGYILVNGTDTPQASQPAVLVSDALAKKVGLPHATAFHCEPMFIWYWKPAALPPVEVKGQMIASHTDELYRATVETLQRIEPADLQKLPDTCGLSLSQLRTFLTLKKR